MNWGLWLTLAIVLFVMLIIFIPINLKAKVSYNILKNNGSVQIKLFKLALIDAYLVIQKGFVELRQKKNGKVFLSPFIFGDSEFQETDIVMILLKKIYIEHGTIYINFGLKDDAFISAMAVGISKTVTSIFGAILKSKKHEARIKNKIYPSFNKDRFLICLKASIKISIWQVLQSLLQSKFRKIKNNKEIMKYE